MSKVPYGQLNFYAEVIGVYIYVSQFYMSCFGSEFGEASRFFIICCCAAMTFNRRFYTWAELRESDDAMHMMDSVCRTTRRVMERYASLSAEELETMLNTMNRNGTDFGHRFCYQEWLGGLCHVQFSCLLDEDMYMLVPRCQEFPSERPIDRVAMRTNGVVCTLAPEAVSAMQRVALQNDTARLHLGGGLPIAIGMPPYACAYCFRRADDLNPCACGMVRYCNRRCQRQHWRVGHKALCRWCISCMEAFGPNEIVD